MNEVLIPTWIKERQAQQEKKRLKLRAVVMAESLICSEATNVWDEFICQLAIQVDGCKSLDEVSQAKLENISQTNPPDKAFKFSVYGSKPFGPLLYTIVRLRLDSSRPYIECLRDAEDHGKDFKIFFHANLLGKVCFMIDVESSPRMAAEYIAKSMIRDLDRETSE